MAAIECSTFGTLAAAVFAAVGVVLAGSALISALMGLRK